MELHTFTGELNTGGVGGEPSGRSCLLLFAILPRSGLGDREEPRARRPARRALREDPADPATWRHLSDCLHRRGGVIPAGEGARAGRGVIGIAVVMILRLAVILCGLQFLVGTPREEL